MKYLPKIAVNKGTLAHKLLGALCNSSASARRGTTSIELDCEGRFCENCLLNISDPNHVNIISDEQAEYQLEEALKLLSVK